MVHDDGTYGTRKFTDLHFCSFGAPATLPLPRKAFEVGVPRVVAALGERDVAPALAGPQHGRGYHRCAGAYAPRGHIPSEPTHASLIGTTNASACPSFARCVCLSSHSDEMICALNVRVRYLVWWQKSMEHPTTSTEDFEVEAWRYTVREHGLHIARPPASSPVSRPCCC